MQDFDIIIQNILRCVKHKNMEEGGLPAYLVARAGLRMQNAALFLVQSARLFSIVTKFRHNTV